MNNLENLEDELCRKGYKFTHNQVEDILHDVYKNSPVRDFCSFETYKQLKVR